MTGIFNKYIRLKYAEPRTGLVQCITCRAKMHWSVIMAGHYIHGAGLKTSLHEMNVHPQCGSCNSCNGRPGAYRKFLKRTYSAGTPSYLRRLSLQPFNPSKKKQLELLRFCQDQIKFLLKVKGLKDQTRHTHFKKFDGFMDSLRGRLTVSEFKLISKALLYYSATIK